MLRTPRLPTPCNYLALRAEQWAKPENGGSITAGIVTVNPAIGRVRTLENLPEIKAIGFAQDAQPLGQASGKTRRGALKTSLHLEGKVWKWDAAEFLYLSLAMTFIRKNY